MFMLDFFHYEYGRSTQCIMKYFFICTLQLWIFEILKRTHLKENINLIVRGKKI